MCGKFSSWIARFVKLDFVCTKLCWMSPFHLPNPCYGACMVSQGNIRSTCMREGGGVCVWEGGSLGTHPSPQASPIPVPGSCYRKHHSSPGGDDARCNTSPVVQLCTFCSKTGVSFGTCKLPFSTARCSSRTRLLSPVQSSPVWYHCCLITRGFSRSTQSQLI